MIIQCEIIVIQRLFKLFISIFMDFFYASLINHSARPQKFIKWWFFSFFCAIIPCQCDGYHLSQSIVNPSRLFRDYEFSFISRPLNGTIEEIIFQCPMCRVSSQPKVVGNDRKMTFPETEFWYPFWRNVKMCGWKFLKKKIDESQKERK
jgi:hypothetical protein